MKKAVVCTKNGLTLLTKKGDTLSGIAQRFPSIENMYQYLYQCNEDAFGGNPDTLWPGETLYLPIPEEREASPLPLPLPVEPPTSKTIILKLDEIRSNVPVLFIMLCIILTLLIVALIVSFYRRSTTPKAPPVTPPVPTPVDFVQQNIPAQTFEELRTLIANSMEHIECSNAENEKHLGTMRNIFTALRDTLTEKDEQIRRFKQSYDAHTFRKFLTRFIRADLAANDFLQDRNTRSKSLDVIKRLLEDALDECGVETFSPAIGEDYRRVEGVADNPKKTASNNATDHYKIAEVIEQGYRMKTLDGYETVYPAKVRIFIMQ